jgi:outer membrane receptor protein involved in Fe transport
MYRRNCLVLVLCLSAFSFAQTFRGSIVGTVTDSSGAAVADAQVTTTSTDAGFSRTTTSDAEGNYTFVELPLGKYDVTATKTGFQTQVLKGVSVGVTIAQRADLKMTPGQVSQTVDVTAEIPLVETAGDTIGGTIESQRVEQLPINGRDYLKLMTLVPGANADPSSVNDAPGSFGIFSINGNRGRANNYLLDGTDMNDGYRNDPAINEAGVFGTPATVLPVDALAEVAILSNTEPEYGRNSGGTVNIVTKSGTNAIHGSASEYFRNDALDARNYFNAEPTPKNSFHNNQFGGSLGGPLIKDRTFWFVAYEGQREVGGLPNIETVPTQAQVDAYTAAGNTINPVIANLLDRNPWAVPGGLPAGNPADPENTSVQVNDPFRNRVDSLIGKIDHHFAGSDRHDLFTGRYFFGDSDQSFPLALGAGSTVPGFNTVTPTRVQLVSLSLTHMLSPKMLVEVRGGWNRFAEGFFPQDSSFDPRTIGLVTNADLLPQDLGLPVLRFGDGTSSLGANNSIPRHRFDTNWQYFTNVSYNPGKHNWKMGYEFRRTFVSAYYDLGYRGRIGFADFDSFLGGSVDNALQFAGDSQRGTHQNNHGFYVQDNYRLTRKLTFNYGLRWDYYGVIGEEKNRFSLFDPASDSLNIVGASGGPSSLYPKDYNNFSPRLSFAYDLFGSSKTVVRGGWGLYYDAFSQDFFIGHFPWNTFNPGPAYNGVGPSAITSGSAGATIQPDVPLFTGFSPTTDAWTVDQNLRTPYIQNFNLNIQQEIGSHAALQVAYVGSQGRKLFRFRDINQPDLTTQEFPFSGFNIINNFESTATSSYNALQVNLKLRNMHGLNSQVNYTWSHSIDTASDGEDYVPNAAQPDDSTNPAAEKANSNFDSRHRFTWDFNYNIPSGSSHHALTSGWSLNGLLRLSSGQPYNLNSFENFNGSNEFFERPDVIGDPFAGTSTPGAILNLSAFAAPCNWDPVAGGCDATNPGYHFGNLRRNAFVGPSYHNFDFSIVKSTNLGERVKMELRADFFNIFNHPNFSNPLLPNFDVDLETNGGVAADPNNSGCTSVPAVPATCRGIGQGFLPISVTSDAGIGNPFLGGGGPRNIELAVKFTF